MKKTIEKPIPLTFEKKHNGYHSTENIKMNIKNNELDKDSLNMIDNIVKEFKRKK